MQPQPTPTRPLATTFDPRTITRPDPALMRYYAVVAVLTVLGFPIALLLGWIRYHTLRYRFDDQGVWMAWGVLFRREINITYRRIQDIHLTRNVIQRWMGLATVSVQTASGSASAEMTIEGIPQADELRDFLYARMRGARGLDDHAAPSAPPLAQPLSQPADDEALALLRQIRDNLHTLAARQERRP